MNQCKEDLIARAEILDGGRSGANVATEQVVEDLGHVLLCLKLELCNVVDEELEQVVAVDLLGELGDGLWNWIVFY